MLGRIFNTHHFQPLRIRNEIYEIFTRQSIRFASFPIYIYTGDVRLISALRQQVTVLLRTSLNI